MKSFLHPSVSLPLRIYIAGGFVRSTSHSITAFFLHEFCASLARGGFLPIWASRKGGFYHPCAQCFSFPSQTLRTAEEQAAPRQRALRQGTQEVPASLCRADFCFCCSRCVLDCMPRHHHLRSNHPQLEGPSRPSQSRHALPSHFQSLLS